MVKKRAVTKKPVDDKPRIPMNIYHSKLRHVTIVDQVRQDHSNFNADFAVVYDKFTQLVGGAQPTPRNIIPLIMRGIRLVERLAKSSQDKGSQKKDLVMMLISKLIADSDLHEEDKILIQCMVEDLGMPIIDGLLDADHGKLLAHGVNKIKEICGCQKIE